VEQESPDAVIHVEVWQASSHLLCCGDRNRAASQRLVQHQDRVAKAMKVTPGFRSPMAGGLVVVKDHMWFGQ